MLTFRRQCAVTSGHFARCSCFRASQTTQGKSSVHQNIRATLPQLSSKTARNADLIDSCQVRGRERTVQPQRDVDHRKQLETMLQLEYHQFNGFIGKVLEMLQYVQILTAFFRGSKSNTRKFDPIASSDPRFDIRNGLFARFGPLDSSVSFLLGQL